MSIQLDLIFSSEGYRGDPSWFEPGGELAGRLRIFPERELNCRQIRVGLAWHTEGIVWPTRKKQRRIQVFKGRLPAHTPAMIDFQLKLPGEPWSYEGTFVSIVWEVEAILDTWGAGKLAAGRKFTLRPFGDLLEARPVTETAGRDLS